jgi:glucose/arabinose dehydrogenase
MPVNSGPSFSSPSTAIVPENRTGVAYQAMASDAENDPLQFTISGGSDAALFSITTSGGVSFKAAPDFENPGDANRDNVYELTLTVSDGKAMAMLPLLLTVENQRFRVRQVASSFNEPVRVLPVGDGSGRLYVVERRGIVWIFNPTTGAVADTPFLDVQNEVSTDGERGLLNLTVNQEQTNLGVKTFVSAYVFLTNPAGDLEVRRYKTAGTTDFERALPETKFEVFRVPHPGNRNNGGGLEFCCSGLQGGPVLTVGFGDADGDVSASKAQDRTSFLGKIVRSIVQGDTYAPTPDDISFSRASALGLRDPRYIGTDRGRTIQELNFFAVRSNYGWPAFEGTQPYSGALASGTTARPPYLQYDLSTPNVNGSAIVGGLVYSGPIEDFASQYFFGDAAEGKVWSVASSAQIMSTST